MNDEKVINVYADFLPYHNELIGKLYASGTKGREFYSVTGGMDIISFI